MRSSAANALRRCCCLCLPIDVFDLRKMCSFVIATNALDVAVNLWVISVYALHTDEFSQEFLTAVFTVLLARVAVSMSAVAVSVVLVKKQKRRHLTYVAVWLVTAFISGVMQGRDLYWASVTPQVCTFFAMRTGA